MSKQKNKTITLDGMGKVTLNTSTEDNLTINVEGKMNGITLNLDGQIHHFDGKGNIIKPIHEIGDQVAKGEFYVGKACFKGYVPTGITSEPWASLGDVFNLKATWHKVQGLKTYYEVAGEIDVLNEDNIVVLNDDDKEMYYTEEKTIEDIKSGKWGMCPVGVLASNKILEESYINYPSMYSINMSDGSILDKAIAGELTGLFTGKANKKDYITCSSHGNSYTHDEGKIYTVSPDGSLADNAIYKDEKSEFSVLLISKM